MVATLHQFSDQWGLEFIRGIGIMMALWGKIGNLNGKLGAG
ncbi:MAG: hypothetical protein OXE82_12340 [Rhodobacter sp.]|nr:hypothetical protein [Rhodobacter sp.]